LLEICPLCSFAETAGTDSSRIRFTPLSRSSGLSSNEVFDIKQDQSRNIWLATNGGLNKFDGYGVTEYKKEAGSNDQLSSNQLTSIATSKSQNGVIWVGTSDSGLIKFDRLKGKSEWLNRRTVKGQNLTSNTILQLAISEDRFLWIGTDRGLNVLNLLTDSTRVMDGELGSERISNIAVLPDNQVWVGTEKGGLFRWDHQSSGFEKIWDASAPITALVMDRRNEIWIGTEGKGLFHYTFGGNRAPSPSNLEIRDVTCLCSDSNGDLWVGTTQGLARQNSDSGNFSIFVHDPGDHESLAGNHITKIFEDQSRMLWIATQNSGTSRFGLDRYWFPHIRKRGDGPNDLPQSSVWSLQTSSEDKTIWVGTEKGIANWNPEKEIISQPVRDAEIQSSYVVSILDDTRKRLWLGTKGNGLFLREADGRLLHFKKDPESPDSLPHNFISQIFEDSRGQIWIGTFGAGVAVFRENKGSFRRIANSKNCTLTYASHIAEDAEGNIWIAGRSGLFIQQKGIPEIRSFEKVFPEIPQLSSHSIATVCPVGNGLVWVGTTNRGLDQINTFSGDIVSYNTVNSNLPDDRIASIVKDATGQVWISTGKEIAQFDNSKGNFRVFSGEDGLQSGNFHLNSVVLGKDHSLYFGGSDGINVISPSDLPAPMQSPIPILTDFEFFGKKVIPGKGEILEKNINRTSEIVIPFDPRNQFAFHFANLDSRYPTRGVFRYTLKGFDKNWHIAKADRRAPYSSLPAGRYRFTVQSSPNGRQWPNNAAQIDILITPPWWNRWWFRILLVVILALGTVLVSKSLIRSRIRQVERREEALKAQRDHAEAALARQLQHSVLIERTTQEFREGMKGDQVLSDSMRNFAEQFQASHCLIAQLTGDANEVLELTGRYSESDASSFEEFRIDAHLPFVKKITNSDEVVIFEKLHLLPKRLMELFDNSASSHLLAIRTTFLDRPNGIIVLQRSRESAPWEEDRIKLLKALSSQFGIAIAQLHLAKQEREYRDRLEDARHHAEVANRAKSDFLAKMTHELRTPLNAIIGFTEIIQEDTTLSKRQRDLVSIVNQSGEHLHDVINDILDLSKIEAGKLDRNDELFELLPLLKSVQEMLAMKAREKGLEFNLETTTAMPGSIRTDRSKLRQTLINLLNNAIKFTDQGTVLWKLGASLLSPPAEKNGEMCRSIRISFEISDTGKGIAEEEIPKLFAKYSQTESGRKSSEEGTGLGLPIAKSFINLLGGDIEVESKPGKGTSFRFYIECDEIAARGEGEQNREGNILSETRAQKINGFTSDLDEVRILIAEDQPTNRLLLKNILGRAGFQIEEVTNGEEAVRKWQEWHPHLILMDEDMPVMRGSEATRIIKSEAGSSDACDPVIVSLTAYALEQAKQSAFEAGVQDFVAKPFRSQELFCVISKHLELDYTFSDAA